MMLRDSKELVGISIPDIPTKSGIYIWYFTCNKKLVPFYVGKSNDLRRRVGEYIVGTFHANRDFINGEAIKYFQKNGYDIILKYRITNKATLQKEEMATIKNFLNDGYVLMNNDHNPDGPELTYNRKIDEKNSVTIRIHKFIKYKILLPLR